jgi:hypothetical protein
MSIIVHFLPASHFSRTDPSYTLSHPTEEQILGLPKSSYDGVVELCFDDMSGLMALLASTAPG